MKKERSAPAVHSAHARQARHAKQEHPRRAWFAPSLALLFLAATAACAWLGRLHVAVPAIYALMSATTFLCYSIDKSAARAKRSRIPESRLHWLAALGGWPGALAAQNLLRHKTRKTGFLAVCWITAAMHAAVLGWWLWR